MPPIIPPTITPTSISATSSRKIQPLPRLYAITDPELMPDAELLVKVEAALKGGCRLLQYRDKNKSNNYVAAARALKQLCQHYNAQFIINDDIELAHAIAANGVHLGQGDTSLHKARQLLGPNAIIGITCHDSLELAQNAESAGANYVAFGRFFRSHTKTEARQAPLDILQQAQQKISIPIVAIGGICLDNSQQIIQAGANTIAVCHGLFAQKNITEVAKDLQKMPSNINSLNTEI